MKKIFRTTASATFLVAATFAQQASAFEGGVPPYPLGASGTNFANFPPIPGLFVLQQFSYTFSDGLYGNNGSKLPIPFHTSIATSTTRLLAAYPFQILGANVYSQLVLPVVSLHTDVAGNKNTQNGLSNITVSPVILGFHPAKNVDISAGLDIGLETGSYSPSKSSVAVGYTSIQPVFAIRYNNPNGLDIGIANRLILNGKNGQTNYQSGDGYVGDFAAGWNFGKLKVGVVGSYLNQYTDDKSNGSVVTGNRARSFAIGPSIVYQMGPVNINLNYQQGIYAANTSKNGAVWLNISLPLWLKTP